MMASKLPHVVPTCLQVRFGPWFKLDWTDRPNHSMAAPTVSSLLAIFDARRWSAAWLPVNRYAFGL
ncbi:hypothetical protein TIFTF001_029709 [Ficus carica]|uniref:Uncharacterized protein n=1 Tax=Ficus carica TaxID=3494 RepID=A0AA88DSC0_FICCA|nr:hypothetical protein TIFTF001_029709 [Ficus carica]